MAYIHVQKLVLDEDRKIKSGSASVMESVYEPNKDGSKKGHSKHIQGRSSERSSGFRRTGARGCSFLRQGVWWSTARTATDSRRSSKSRELFDMHTFSSVYTTVT